MKHIFVRVTQLRSHAMQLLILQPIIPGLVLTLAITLEQQFQLMRMVNTLVRHPMLLEDHYVRKQSKRHSMCVSYFTCLNGHLLPAFIVLWAFNSKCLTRVIGWS